MTIVLQTVSKSKLKSRLPEYLKNAKKNKKPFKEDPTEPVGENDWEALN